MLQIAIRAAQCYNFQYTAAIVQWQNAALWQRMSWVRNPLAAPNISDTVTLRFNLAPSLPSLAYRLGQASLRWNFRLGLSDMEAGVLSCGHAGEALP